VNASTLAATEQTNPFSPGFGRTPHALVGRDALLADLGGGLVSGPRDHRYASLLLGVRGSGKTVVLNELEDRAAQDGWVVLSADGSSRGLAERIASAVARTRGDHLAVEEVAKRDSRLQSFGVRLGVLAATWAPQPAASLRPPATMADTLMELARAAATAGTSVLLTVDELHAVDREEARRLSSDVQHIAGRSGLPLAFVGAGLLEMRYTLLADTKITFLQRCERYEIPALDEADIAAGLSRPIRDAGGEITHQALQAAVAFVRGQGATESGHSPYRLQILGHTMWRLAGAPQRVIEASAVDRAVPAARAAVDRSICAPAWHELSDSAQSCLAAVVAAPHVSTGDLVLRVAQRCGLSARQAGNIRRRLVLAGYLVDEPGGAVGLTDLVPGEVVSREAPEELSHYASGPGSHGPGRGTGSAAFGSLCRRWMPRARAHCVLPTGHSGRCRSRL
jgi:type II secretory pathway predicted ATPase ExeA